MIRYSYVCIVIKLVFFLDFFETRPCAFRDNFYSIARETIGF